MISQTLRNMAVGSEAKIADISAALDGSLKARLAKMRGYRDQETGFCEIDAADNCIADVMYAIYNFARLRHADKIGVTYWMIACEDGQTLVPVDFFTMLDGKVHSIRRSNAILSGDLEFPANTWESDMECLVTFMETNSKSGIVGQYRTLQSKMEAERKGEPVRSMESFEPTGSHRAVDAMMGTDYSESTNVGFEIEQFVESVPEAGKVRKNREKRISQDTVSHNAVTVNTGKGRRKSDKTVVDGAYRSDETDSQSMMPVKAKSRSTRKSSMTSN